VVSPLGMQLAIRLGREEAQLTTLHKIQPTSAERTAQHGHLPVRAWPPGSRNCTTARPDARHVLGLSFRYAGQQLFRPR
jgi:hypothetical protein